MRVLTLGLGLFVVLVIAFMIAQSSCLSAPHDAAIRVPVGSRLSNLDHWLIRGPGSDGEVERWLTTPKKDATLSNEFGHFLSVNLGSYDHWKASIEERDQFTGKLTFVHHGSTSSDITSLIYVEGKLCKKDWGFLPG